MKNPAIVLAIGLVLSLGAGAGLAMLARERSRGDAGSGAGAAPSSGAADASGGDVPRAPHAEPSTPRASTERAPVADSAQSPVIRAGGPAAPPPLEASPVAVAAPRRPEATPSQAPPASPTRTAEPTSHSAAAPGRAPEEIAREKDLAADRERRLRHAEKLVGAAAERLKLGRSESEALQMLVMMRGDRVRAARYRVDAREIERSDYETDLELARSSFEEDLAHVLTPEQLAGYRALEQADEHCPPEDELGFGRIYGIGGGRVKTRERGP